MKKQLLVLKNTYALSENAALRYITFAALYVAQGIPEGLLWFAIPAWLAMNGNTPLEIGSYLGIIGLPWSFKILVAPLMDRFTYLPMGRKRPWVLFGQLGLMTSFISMSFINDPINNLFWLMVAGFFISFFGAFQDVAVDGMAIDLVPINEQARANGIMWGSKTIGISVSLAIGTWIINNYSFSTAVISASFFVIFIFLIPLFIREKPNEKLVPWTKGEASESSKKNQLGSVKLIIQSLLKVFILPSSLLMGVAVFSFSMGIGLMDALLPVFTIQEIGWTNSVFSNTLAAAKVIAGIIGMFAGGALVDFFGKSRMMSYYLIAFILLIATMVLGKIYWQNDFFVKGFIIGYALLDTLLYITIFASAMALCWKKVSATQFTLYMAISNLGIAFGSSLLGPLKALFTSWDYVILSFLFFAIIMLLLIQKINFNKHLTKIELLENNQLSTT